MHSELKKLVYVCIALLVFSIAFTIYACLRLSGINDFLTVEEYTFFVICSYLIAFVPVLLIIIIVLTKKLIEVLEVMDSYFSEQIKEIKKSTK